MIVQQPSSQIEVQLGHLCNNRCVFCVSGQLSERKQAEAPPVEPIRAELAAARKNGAQRLTFLGGEPTLQASFLGLLRYAVELDFPEIVIFTNGTMTPRSSFRERAYAILRELGPDAVRRVTWRFSLQGGDRESHDVTTGNPGAWERIQASLKALRAEGARLTGNMCVVASNYASILSLCDIAATYGFEDLHFDIVRPRDAGERTDAQLRAMMNRYSEMAPHFEALSLAVDARLGADFDLNFGNVPYCTALSVAHRIHHDGEATVTVAAEGDGTTRAGFDKYTDKRTDKRKRPGCIGCVFDASCSGVLDKYVEFHGDDEFQAVTAPALWARDQGGHHFTLLVLPAVQALQARGLMRLWGSDQRAGHVHVTVGPEAAPWRLTLRRSGHPTPPGSTPWAQMTVGRIHVDFHGSWPQHRGALAELQRSLGDLAQALGEPEVDGVALTALEGSWQRHDAATQRTLRSLERLCTELGRRNLGGLKPLGGTWNADGRGAELRYGNGKGSLILSVFLDLAEQGRPAAPRFRHAVTGLADAQVSAFNRELGATLRQLSARPSP